MSGVEGRSFADSLIFFSGITYFYSFFLNNLIIGTITAVAKPASTLKLNIYSIINWYFYYSHHLINIISHKCYKHSYKLYFNRSN